jgi:ATP-dependent Clp protease protease subunit
MTWFNLAALQDGEQTHNIVTIDGEIGASWWSSDGVASSDFLNAVAELGDIESLHINMNSPGGSVTDGLTIANYLRQHKAKITMTVLGQASSIASVIACACDEVEMGVGSFGLLHYPWTIASGNEHDLRAIADDLAVIRQGIMENYVAKTGEDKRKEIEALLLGKNNQGTLLSAEQWVELGLADSLMVESKAAANANSSMSMLMSAITHAAAQARTAIAKAEEQPELTLEVIQSKHAELYQAIAAQANAEFEVTAKAEFEALAVVRVNEAVALERTRATEILSACASTNQIHLAEKLLSNSMSLEDARQYIFDVAAAASASQGIFNSHSPEGGQSKGVDTSSIYAKRNRKA